MSDPQDKKIFVDENWKTQVQAEKDAAAKAPDTEPTDAQSAETSAADTSATSEQPDPGSEYPDSPLPAPTLASLVTVLATQAMVALGIMPNPMTGQVSARPNEAKHFVDTIELIRDKTEGNRTDEETQMLDHFLHELRMTFVALQQQKNQP